jgi:hypothetical protein
MKIGYVDTPRGRYVNLNDLIIMLYDAKSVIKPENVVAMKVVQAIIESIQELKND